MSGIGSNLPVLWRPSLPGSTDRAELRNPAPVPVRADTRLPAPRSAPLDAGADVAGRRSTVLPAAADPRPALGDAGRSADDGSNAREGSSGRARLATRPQTAAFATQTLAQEESGSGPASPNFRRGIDSYRRTLSAQVPQPQLLNLLIP